MSQTDRIQLLQTDGFQVGTDPEVNASAPRSTGLRSAGTESRIPQTTRVIQWVEVRPGN